MQTINKKVSMPFMLTILCATLFAFSPAPGGDKFEIYLNNKLMLEQYIGQAAGAKYLTLHQNNYNDQIDVYYSHCGQTGRDRTISLKKADGSIVKQWKFADAAGSKKMMSWKVKEIMDLQKDKTASLKLYYSSRELPGGKLLATVVRGNNSYAKLY